MSEVVWKRRASDDLDRLLEVWRERGEAVGRRAAGASHKAARALRENHRLGRPMNDETERRELAVLFGAGAYVLRYRVAPNVAVVVLRVWHSREGVMQ